ncbi:MAG: hypothetical protein EOP84_00775, partial [Verrucomicrobiaceae bacterium]
MTVDRTLFDTRFETLPNWGCPTCGKGHLQVVKAALKIEETGPSIKSRDHEAFEPDWISKRFVGLLKCNFGLCEEIATVGGNVFLAPSVEEDPSGYWREIYSDVFEPHFIWPAPLPIRAIEGTPDAVQGALNSITSIAGILAPILWTALFSWSIAKERSVHV